MIATVKQAIQRACAAGLEDIDAQVLLCFALKKPRSYLFTWPEAELEAQVARQYQTLIERRLSGEPVAYLTGEREFWSLTLKTSPTTLIPRPETELLVETVLETVKTPMASVVDLGTGTGAIALAIKQERPSWRVLGVDRVASAVSLAAENARNLSIDVPFTQGHWLTGVAPKSFDVIVSNPPYIDENDPHLKQGDVRFEPESALVSGNHGLADIQEITAQACLALSPGGFLFFEHGWQQASDVRDILNQAGFIAVVTRQDLAGRDRVTFGRWPCAD